MNSLTDQQLLREYADRRSEPAFAELVRRHVNFVYSAALRMLRDSHLAEDVTQGVFVTLAANAPRLGGRPVLAGWLHCTARNLAAKAVRSDIRRRAREHEAATMHELLSAQPDALWEQIAQHLDAALEALNEPERDAVLLRYFEHKSAREMGPMLGISDEAAQKRVSRAIERMREFFAKRGITVGANGLIAVVSANAVHAAPGVLVVTIPAAALLAGSAAQSSTAIAATQSIAMTTTQKTLVAVVIALSLAAPLLVHQRAQARLRQQEETLRQQAEQFASLRLANEVLPVNPARTRPTPADGQLNEALKLRNEVGRLQSAVLEVSASKTNAPFSREETLAAMRQLYSDRVTKLKRLFAANPAQTVPELQYLTDDAWRDLVAYDHQRIDPESSRAMSQARTIAQRYFAFKVLSSALQEYGNANNGQFPTELAQLASYFESPVDSSVLDGWEIVPGRSLPRDLRVEEAWVITQKAPINAELDQRIVVGLRGVPIR